jgi:peroxiredoxin Q/BCP
MMTNLARLTAFALGVALGTSPAAAEDKQDDKIELKVGDVAPTFQLQDHADKAWSSSDRVGKKWVVIYFYPGDFTPGCTAQARAFNGAMEKLAAKGVEVVGISGDGAATHDLFRVAQKLTFTLLADPKGAAAKQFGVPFGSGATVKAKDAEGKAIEFKREGTAARWTFVVGKDGKIAYKNTKVTPSDDAKKIAEFIDAAEKK